MKYFILLIVLIFLMIPPLSAFSQQGTAKGSAVNYGRNDETGKYVHIRGFEMHYEVYGNGSPLLLIHGNGGSIVSMANQIPFFSKSYQVIAADSRSQGKSFDAQDSLSYEMMADDYNALMDSLHLDSAYIVGWSDGGIVGLLLAIRHPGKVKKLAVTGANIRPDTTAVSAADINFMKEQLLNLHDQKQDAKTRNEIKLTQLMLDGPFIPFNSLQQIHCPVLVIGGDHDIIKTEHTMEIYKSIPGASLWILPGSGHDTCIRFKDDFNTQVNRFFLNTPQP